MTLKAATGTIHETRVDPTNPPLSDRQLDQLAQDLGNHATKMIATRLEAIVPTSSDLSKGMLIAAENVLGSVVSSLAMSYGEEVEAADFEARLREIISLSVEHGLELRRRMQEQEAGSA